MQDIRQIWKQSAVTNEDYEKAFISDSLKQKEEIQAVRSIIVTAFRKTGLIITDQGAIKLESSNGRKRFFVNFFHKNKPAQQEQLIIRLPDTIDTKECAAHFEPIPVRGGWPVAGLSWTGNFKLKINDIEYSVEKLTNKINEWKQYYKIGEKKSYDAIYEQLQKLEANLANALPEFSIVFSAPQRKHDHGAAKIDCFVTKNDGFQMTIPLVMIQSTIMIDKTWPNGNKKYDASLRTDGNINGFLTSLFEKIQYTYKEYTHNHNLVQDWQGEDLTL